MKGNTMASPRKKKMAKYMIDDLLAIAKKTDYKIESRT